MTAKAFTAQEDAWLKEHHRPEQTVKDLTAEYNAEFGENRSAETMKHHIRRLGLRQERRNFTAAQDAWLVENAPLLSVEETAKQFNALFGTCRSAQVLKVRCNRSLGVHHANWRFGLGCPIGTETVHNGYTWVKVSDKDGAGFYQNWKPKHRVVWERCHGPLPDGWIVVFLDRNHGNCGTENLYAINGRVAREMAKKSWWFANRDLTLAAIKWCELFYATKEATDD